MISVAASKACALGVLRLALVGGGLKDHFQIDRHRVIAGRDHVLLMHVGGGKAVEERKPGAGAPEEPVAAFPIGARRCDR